MTTRHEIRPLTGRIADSDAARASQVKALMRERRKVAVTFSRTQDEHDRAELVRIDQELAQHHIDIPAIQEQVAMRKRGIREPVLRRAECARTSEEAFTAKGSERAPMPPTAPPTAYESESGSRPLAG